MNIKERLKAAYENVTLSADKTWIHDSLLFQKANQELFNKECQLQLMKLIELRPRTVKDCIPKSKLAQYFNYEYNEARELSYAPSSSSFNNFVYYSRELTNPTNEPWLLPEVDDLFIWFTSYHHFAKQTSYNSLKKNRNPVATIYNYEPVNYESPILRVDTFDKRILKMQIISDRIKNIWKINCIFTEEAAGFNDKIFNLYRAPGNFYYISEQGTERKGTINEKSTNEAKLQDFEHLEWLGKSFREQNSWIFKYTTTKVLPQKILHGNNHSDSKTDLIPSKRLYSAVLQGIANNKKQISTKHEHFCPLINSKEQEEKETDKVKFSTKNEIFRGICLNLQEPLQASFKFDAKKNFYTDNLNLKMGQSKDDQHGILKQSNSKINNKTKISEPLSTCINSNSTVHGITSGYVQPSISYTAFPNSVPLATQQYFRRYNCQFNTQFSSNLQTSYIYTNTLTTNMSQIVVSRGVQSSCNYISSPPLIMMQQNRTTTLYPIFHQYIPGSHYSSISGHRPLQKWIQSDNARSPVIQQAYPTSVLPNYIPQPHPQWIDQTSNRFFQNSIQCRKPPHTKNRSKNQCVSQPQPILNIPQTRRRCKTFNTFNCAKVLSEDLNIKTNNSISSTEIKSSLNEFQRCDGNYKDCVNYVEDINQAENKKVDCLFEETSDFHVPVTSSLSEELEIQALEEYCNSTDNVYQELERQAEEQYEQDNSENWKGPPNNIMFIGGLSFRWDYV